MHLVRGHAGEQGPAPRSVRHRRASTVRRQHRPQPEPGQPQRVPGQVHDRPQNSSASVVEARGQRREAAGARRAPSAPRPSAVSAMRAAQHGRAPAVERVGEVELRPAPAQPVLGQRQRAQERRRRRRSGGRPSTRRAAARAASARALRVPPPIRSAASSTVTWHPAWASATAAASPFGPEPTTTASVTAFRGLGAAAAGAASGSTVTGIVGSPSSQGWRGHHVGRPARALLDDAGRRVDDAVLLPRPVDRLRLQHDDPHVAVGVTAPLLDCREQLFVVQVAVAEVPAQHAHRPRSRPRRPRTRSRSSTARGRRPLSARPWWCMARHALPRFSTRSASLGTVHCGQLGPHRRRDLLMWVSSRLSAPPRNSHTLVAQLPA